MKGSNKKVTSICYYWCSCLFYKKFPPTHTLGVTVSGKEVAWFGGFDERMDERTRPEAIHLQLKCHIMHETTYNKCNKCNKNNYENTHNNLVQHKKVTWQIAGFISS